MSDEPDLDRVDLTPDWYAERIAQARGEVVDEVYRLALDLCTCEGWSEGRPHGYMCPTRRLRKRLRRIA